MYPIISFFTHRTKQVIKKKREKDNFLNNNDVLILDRNLLSALKFQRFVKQPLGL